MLHPYGVTTRETCNGEHLDDIQHTSMESKMKGGLLTLLAGTKVEGDSTHNVVRKRCRFQLDSSWCVLVLSPMGFILGYIAHGVDSEVRTGQLRMGEVKLL